MIHIGYMLVFMILLIHCGIGSWLAEVACSSFFFAATLDMVDWAIDWRIFNAVREFKLHSLNESESGVSSA